MSANLFICLYQAALLETRPVLGALLLRPLCYQIEEKVQWCYQSSPGSSAGLKSKERPPHLGAKHVHLWMNGNQNQTGSQQAANNLQWPQKCIFRLCKLFSWVFCQGLGTQAPLTFSP